MNFHKTDAIDDDQALDSARKLERDSTLLVGQLYLPDSPEPIQVRIRNLSAAGLMAQPTPDVENGTRVRIGLRNIEPVDGRIAWATASQFGIAFDAPIDPMTVRRPPDDFAEADESVV